MLLGCHRAPNSIFAPGLLHFSLLYFYSILFHFYLFFYFFFGIYLHAGNAGNVAGAPLARKLPGKKRPTG